MVVDYDAQSLMGEKQLWRTTDNGNLFTERMFSWQRSQIGSAVLFPPGAASLQNMLAVSVLFINDAHLRTTVPAMPRNVFEYGKKGVLLCATFHQIPY